VTKITSADIRQAILKTYAAPEWAVMWEVSNATGAVRGKQRYADAVMMSLWPSRGLELHGVEIKVSRSDWKREAADPSKAETIATYCDRWWVFVAPGVIHDTAEIPPNWGVREWDGRRWKTIQEAQRNGDVATCDRRFLAALLRRGDETERRRIDDEVRKAVDAARTEIDRRVKEAVDRHTKMNAGAADWIEKFQSETGLDIRNAWGLKDPKEFGAAVKLVTEVGLDNTYAHLKHTVKALQQGAETAAEAIRRYENRDYPDDIRDLLG
jgi:hypothetical protein